MEPIAEVTQTDREAAAACARYFEHSFTSDEILAGEADMCTLVAILRNHRLSTPSPALKADNAALEQWRHKTRGTVYEKIGVAELPCAAGLNPGEGDGLVIYRGEDGKLWARLADEFHDGRFEAVAGLTTDS